MADLKDENPYLPSTAEHLPSDSDTVAPSSALNVVLKTTCIGFLFGLFITVVVFCSTEIHVLDRLVVIGSCIFVSVVAGVICGTFLSILMALSDFSARRRQDEGNEI